VENFLLSGPSPAATHLVDKMPQLTLSSYISAIDSAVKAKNGPSLARLFALNTSSPSSPSLLLLEFLQQQTGPGLYRQDRLSGSVSSLVPLESCSSFEQDRLKLRFLAVQSGSVPSYAGQFSRTLRSEWAEIATCHVQAVSAMNVCSFASISSCVVSS
jgi:hypothetical protein